MRSTSNATELARITATGPDARRRTAARAALQGAAAPRRPRRAAPAGVLLGLLGVVGFSFTLPATRLAVADLDPWFVAFARASLAGALAAAYLAAVRAPLPTRAQWGRLALVAGGAIVGFPLFTSIALVTSESQHGAVVVALLPAATALAAVARAGERPGPLFWAAATAGLAIVLTFTLAQSGGAVTVADLLLLAAIASCAVAYAEGGVLSRDLGGARTICWALILALPATLPTALVSGATSGLAAGSTAWLGLAYLSVVSMFLGFFAWYAGLARGGVARVGQIQLLQPLMTFAWAGLILGEHVTAGTVLAALAVLASVVVTQRARIGVVRSVSPCPPPSSSSPSPSPPPSRWSPASASASSSPPSSSR